MLFLSTDLFHSHLEIHTVLKDVSLPKFSFSSSVWIPRVPYMVCCNMVQVLYSGSCSCASTDPSIHILWTWHRSDVIVSLSNHGKASTDQNDSKSVTSCSLSWCHYVQDGVTRCMCCITTWSSQTGGRQARAQPKLEQCECRSAGVWRGAHALVSGSSLSAPQEAYSRVNAFNRCGNGSEFTHFID